MEAASAASMKVEVFTEVAVSLGVATEVIATQSRSNQSRCQPRLAAGFFMPGSPSGAAVFHPGGFSTFHKNHIFVYSVISVAFHN